MPQLATTSEFVLHGMLACSALHLAYLYPSENNFTILAAHHQDLGLPLFRHAIDNVSKENCHAVLVFTHLLVIYSFAAEKQDERLFLVENDGPSLMPGWLYFTRGGCSMLCSVWDYLETGPVADLANCWELPFTIPHTETEQPLQAYFMAMIPTQASTEIWSEAICQTYTQAATELVWAFRCAYLSGDRLTTWDLLRIWPMRISQDYIVLLSQKHPSALILLAHYCLLLNKMGSAWFFNDRAERLLLGITYFLDLKWHWCIQWPIDEIGNFLELLPPLLGSSSG